MSNRFSSLGRPSLWLTVLALSLGSGSAALAQATQAPVATDSRVKTFVYNENDVYNLLTYYGFQSNVEFGPKETIETVSIGDRAGWQVVPAGRRLFIRAVANELHTNMTVVTNVRAYQFDLRATDPSTVPQEELVYVIRFFYPDDTTVKNQRSAIVPAAPLPLTYPTPAPQPTAYAPPAAVAAAPIAPLAPLAPLTPAPGFAPAPAPIAASAPPITSYTLNTPASSPVTGAGTLPRAAAPATTAPTMNRYGAGPFDTPLAPGAHTSAALPPAAPAALAANNPALNFNYTYNGDGEAVPQAIFDDGKNTYFRYNDAKIKPKIYAISANGKETQLKYRREGDALVVAKIGSQFGIAVGNKLAVIYNEANK
jgi:P-type conjugative transfer protein VirB9